MLKTHKLFTLMIVILALAVLAAPVSAQVTPSVTVKDQAIADGTVTVQSVVSSGVGWIVIHTQKDGNPGPVIGYAPVKDGTNENVVVKVDAAKATDTLYAMLHTDAGKVGEYEFPGLDVPVMVDGKMVSPPFKVTSAAMTTTSAMTTTTPSAVTTTTTSAVTTTTSTAAPTTLPATGEMAWPWTQVLLAIGGLIVATGVSVFFVRRSHRA